MASLPVTIFKFAMSPYENWQQLAWAGVFLITHRRAGPEHPGPCTDAQQNLTRPVPCVTAWTPLKSQSPQDFWSRPELLLRQVPRAEGHQPGDPREESHRLHRPSGCGKSTLLRTFNRMYELYPEQRAEGEILLDGENLLTAKQDVALIRAKVGMVFQKPTPFPMSIYDNIAFGVRLFENLSSRPTWTTGWNGRCARQRCGPR
jgi:hypothetical protein